MHFAMTRLRRNTNGERPNEARSERCLIKSSVSCRVATLLKMGCITDGDREACVANTVPVLEHIASISLFAPFLHAALASGVPACDLVIAPSQAPASQRSRRYLAVRSFHRRATCHCDTSLSASLARKEEMDKEATTNDNTVCTSKTTKIQSRLGEKTASMWCPAIFGASGPILLLCLDFQCQLKNWLHVQGVPSKLCCFGHWVSPYPDFCSERDRCFRVVGV